MHKKALLALMLAMAMLLSGCALIKKDAAVDAATEIIRLGDLVATKGEIQDEVNYQLQYMAMQYAYYGMSYDVTNADNIKNIQDQVIESHKSHLATLAQIAEKGFDKLTEEEEARAKEDAETAFQANLDQYLAEKYADSDMSEEEKKAAAIADMEKRGYTMEAELKSARETISTEKLREDITKDVTVAEEEIKAEYDSKVESAKSTYETNASSYCSAFNNGTKVYYTPAGVRLVKQILIQYSAEQQTAIAEAKSRADAAQAILDKEDATEEEKTQAQADLDAANAEVASLTDAAYASIDAEADDVIAQLDAGADWDTLMAEKTQDPGMKEGRATAVTGYAVCKDMAGFDSAFVEAAMALEKVGDYSAKTRGSSNGYYIIKYVGDAAEGAIAYESVKDELQESLLTTKKNTTYNEAVKSWVEAANFKIDLGALNN